MYKFFIFLVFAATAVTGENVVSNLTTIPRFDNSEFASGLEKLEISVNFNNSQNFLSCQWNVWMDKKITIFDIFASCPNPNCKKIGKYYIFNLTITDPIPNYLNVTLSCLKGFNQMLNKSLLLQSKDCDYVTSERVNVTFSGSARYNTPGAFSCPLNGSLRYLNDSVPMNVTTSCLANAKWDKEELFKCWRAPVNVVLLGNLEIIEGNSATFECSYTDVNPIGNESAFFCGSNETILKKGEHLLIGNVSRNLNKKTIFCQAITPYTVTSTLGQSTKKTLTVFYMPSFKIVDGCNWEIGASQSCLINVDSNPYSTLQRVEKDGAIIAPSANGLHWEMNSNQLSFFTNKVLHNDSGNYRVTVTTPLLNKSSSFSFQIHTNGTTPTPVFPPITWYLVIGGSAGGFLLLLLIFVIAIIRIKAKRNGENLAMDLHGDAGSIGNEYEISDAIDQIIYDEAQFNEELSGIGSVQEVNELDASIGVDQNIYDLPDIDENTIAEESEGSDIDISAVIEQVIYEEAQFNEELSGNGLVQEVNELDASIGFDQNIYDLPDMPGVQSSDVNNIAEESEASSAEEPTSSTAVHPDIAILYTCVKKDRKTKHSADKVET